MPLTSRKVEELFGGFNWKNSTKHKGLVEIIGDWEKCHIITLPNKWGLITPHGKPAVIRCHRLISKLVAAALTDLAGQRLLGLIQTFDGCFVPRHKSWNPRRSLSRHAWGIAVDLNARICPYGSKAKQPAKVLSAFRAHGFEWGGDWSTPDPMHFEAIRSSGSL